MITRRRLTVLALALFAGMTALPALAQEATLSGTRLDPGPAV